VDATDLAFAGLARQAALIRSGEVSSRELVELYLRRIESLDPRLNAFRMVFAERALAEAEQADGRHGAGEERPLLGVPVAIKDDCEVAGEVTAHGSNAFDGPEPADADVVRRLRAAGAIVLGKTHVPELEIVPATESPTFGVTRNPWDLQRTPGGSSGGTAAAVAAGLVGGGLGSDGGGSIRIPAGCCGLFGLKPQRDRISLAPRGAAWRGLSVYGPITRTVADAALFLDAVTDGAHGYADAARRPPERLRVAVSYKVAPGILTRPDAEQRGAVERIAERLRALGHEVSEHDPSYGTVVSAFTVRYLRGIRDDVLATPHRRRLARRTRAYARLGAAYPPPVVQRAVAAGAAHRDRIAASLDGFDVLLTPMFTRRPVPIGEWEGRGALLTFNGSARWVPYCATWNHTGQPAASVPAGLTSDGFPLAAQLVGPPDGEALLLSLAAQLEADLDWPAQRPPIA
jgi:amidase